MAKKMYQMTVMLTLSEKPEGKTWTVHKMRGRIQKVVKKKDKWLVTVVFRASSMIELMVACDEQTIKSELH